MASNTPIKIVVLTLLAIVSSIGSSGPALANDGDIQRVLDASGCPSAKLRVVYSKLDTIVYEANCFSTSHKILTVECHSDVCKVNAGPRDDQKG